MYSRWSAASRQSTSPGRAFAAPESAVPDRATDRWSVGLASEGRVFCRTVGLPGLRAAWFPLV
eukprot:COSAG02_NODE_1665_length_11425_cov_4.620872_6_plen_63_part_00